MNTYRHISSGRDCSAFEENSSVYDYTTFSENLIDCQCSPYEMNLCGDDPYSSPCADCGFNPYLPSYKRNDDYPYYAFDYDLELLDFAGYLNLLVQTEEFFDNYTREPEDDIARIIKLVNSDFESTYNELQRNGMNKNLAQYLFRLIVSYTVRNASKYTGNLNQRVIHLYDDLRRQVPWIFLTFRGYAIPYNRISEIIRSLISFTLHKLEKKSRTSKAYPVEEWSDWEYLDGVLNSGPAVASWGRNRIDVFARGFNEGLWHTYFDGSEWGAWENLGGNLTSSPAAASWGQDRIDVFAKGINNTLWHICRNGSSWSQWEDLGGTFSLSPSAVSRGLNRLDVFARSISNNLLHKFWDGTSWSQWQNLGGLITSSPSAVSWGPDRIDVFARGLNDSLWHLWWNGSSWSQWEDLGGQLSSGPAASFRAANRIDVFASDKNSNLIFKYWNGVNWSSWQNLDGTLTSEPASVSWGPDRIDVFARGLNKHLWHIYKD